MRGQNSRAVEAKERKRIAELDKQQREEAVAEDLKWKDDDKHINKKLNRKADTAAKNEARVGRRNELRKLEADESEALHQKHRQNKGTGVKKITQNEILMRMMQSTKETEPKKDDSLREYIPDNLMAEEMVQSLNREKPYIEASGVDNAISALCELGGGNENEEKMTFSTFKEEMLPQIKLEYPLLKRSQQQEKVWEEWKKRKHMMSNQ